MLGARPTRPPRRAWTPAGNGGFTLIEVLVAVLLLSIGLLGLAALQTSSLRNNGSALIRSHATLMANDVLDMMRADVSSNNPNYGAYVTDYTTAAPAGTSQADRDLASWKGELSKLPGGEGKITVNGNSVTVSVRWLEKWDPTLDQSNASARYAYVTFTTQL